MQERKISGMSGSGVGNRFQFRSGSDAGNRLRVIGRVNELGRMAGLGSFPLGLNELSPKPFPKV